MRIICGVRLNKIMLGGSMTKERIEKELQKTYAQLEQLKQKAKDLEEQKELVEKAETMKLIEKNKISSEQLQLLIRFSEQEILQLLKQKEKEENDEKEENTESKDCV